MLVKESLEKLLDLFTKDGYEIPQIVQQIYDFYTEENAKYQLLKKKKSSKSARKESSQSINIVSSQPQNSQSS